MPRILLVDDDHLLRLTIVMTLEEAGYEVVPAKDGAEALAILADDPSITLVLSDINMPGSAHHGLATGTRRASDLASYLRRWHDSSTL